MQDVEEKMKELQKLCNMKKKFEKEQQSNEEM